MVKLGNGPRVPVPRRHVDNIRARTTSRPPEGVAVDLYDWATEAFTPGETQRLKVFFDSIPTFNLLPDEETQP